MNKHAFTEESEGSKVRFNILISTWGQSKSMLLEEEPFLTTLLLRAPVSLSPFVIFFSNNPSSLCRSFIFSMYECLKIQTYIIGGKKRQVL